ncbi:uroporphyrinogen-III synthase [Sphingobium mellinum]|uniref:uroporphyrinogen-III synthase n=1 Tax=Sphingobium mellinum TaxID=1387166 RepID=UPI0030EB8798
MRPLIILRPEPGASQTAARAERLGLRIRRCPLFEARPVIWKEPAPDRFDALLLTSAQAARLAGPKLERYRSLPAYAVGRATARALEERGFAGVIAGEQGGSAIAARIARDGHRHVLHLGGTTVARIDPGPLTIERIAIYTIGVTKEPRLDEALEPGAVLLVHSPRAGQRLAELIAPDRRAGFHLIAISAATLAACGTGWASGEAPDLPDDERMLALAVRLCE